MVIKLPFTSKITDEVISKCLNAVVQKHKNDCSDKLGKQSVFADASASNSNWLKGKLSLSIVAFKIPEAADSSKNRPLHPKIIRMELPHSLTDASSSVLLVTKDHPKPRRRNTAASFAQSSTHYTQLLTSAGCNHLISEVMSISQLRDEYSLKESKQELAARTDVVLCDQKIILSVPRLLGYPFDSVKKFPMAIEIREDGVRLKDNISRALSQTALRMTFKNTQTSLVFGRAFHTVEQLSENLLYCLRKLCMEYPGGWANIKTLYITMGLKARAPLYISEGKGSDVPAIKIETEKPEVFEDDFGFGLVKMTATGDILSYEPPSDDEEASNCFRQKRKSPTVSKKSKKMKSDSGEAKETAASDVKEEFQ